MNWAQNILDDEAVFPNTIGMIDLPLFFSASLTESVGVAFPRTFKDTVRTIVRRLFRVYAHIYSNHFDQICALGIEGTFESLFLALCPFPLMYTSPP
jgi:MOB kinase activator 1